MDVKTFEAFSMKDAIKAVKREFGQDAVILKTSERASPRGKIFEVMASPGSSTLRSGARAQSHLNGSILSRDDIVHWQRSLNELSGKVQHLEEICLKRDHLNRLESDLREIRALLGEDLSRKSGSLYEGLVEPLRDIVKRLQLMEIDHSIIINLLKYLKGLPTEQIKVKDQLFEYYQAQSIKWMLKRIRIAPLWNPVMGERQLQVLVGPTGAGKTTSIAKLAAKFFLKEEKKVVVFSFDNQRLGATEQIRIFSKVIGVPFESVSKLEDCETLMSRYSDKDLILLDTAGRSPKSHQAIEELSKLKNIPIAMNFHLVLSVTDRKDQIERTIRSFTRLGIQSLIFTKLDESWSYGEVFNASLKWGIPLSYFGIGQRMPEDLERASRERVLERIFGL